MGGKGDSLRLGGKSVSRRERKREKREKERKSFIGKKLVSRYPYPSRALRGDAKKKE